MGKMGIYLRNLAERDEEPTLRLGIALRTQRDRQTAQQLQPDLLGDIERDPSGVARRGLGAWGHAKTHVVQKRSGGLRHLWIKNSKRSMIFWTCGRNGVATYGEEGWGDVFCAHLWIVRLCRFYRLLEY